MIFLLLVPAFILLVVLFMQINAFISGEIEARSIVRQLASESETYHAKEIKSGPIKSFLAEICKKHNLPSNIKIYSIDGFTFIVSSFGSGQIDNFSPFTVPVATNLSKSCIFIPKQWISELNEKEMRLVITHETSHIRSSRKYKFIRAFFLSHISPFFKNFLKKIQLAEEIKADAFAAKEVGKDTVEEFLLKLIDKNPDISGNLKASIEKRVAALKTTA